MPGIRLYRREEQATAVKSLLLNRGVFAVLPTRYGKSFISSASLARKNYSDETNTDTAYRHVLVHSSFAR